MTDLDEFAIGICVNEGIPMALQDDDKVEAVRRMCERDIPWKEQARRLKCNFRSLMGFAAYHDLHLSSYSKD